MRILFVSPTPTHPTNAGNRARILNMCEVLRAAGHEICFLHVCREKGDVRAMADYFGPDHVRETPYRRPARHETPMQKLSRWLHQLVSRDARHRWKIDDWYTASTTEACRSWHAQVRFDAVIIEYVFLSKAFEAFDRSVVRILDTHDRFSDRHRLYLQQGLPPQFFSTSQKEEALALARADWVLAIQDEENAFFRSLGASRVLTVGHLLPTVAPRQTRAPGPLRLLFVGSENPINVDGMQHFLRRTWPQLHARGHDVQISIAGGVCRALAPAEGVDLLGYVDDLAPLYSQADVVINPVRTGTGLNIKSVEALAYGCLLLSSPEGARGLEQGASRGVVVASTDAEWLTLLERAALAPAECRQLGQAGRAYADTWNQNASARLLSILTSGTTENAQLPDFISRATPHTQAAAETAQR